MSRFMTFTALGMPLKLSCGKSGGLQRVAAFDYCTSLIDTFQCAVNKSMEEYRINSKFRNLSSELVI